MNKIISFSVIGILGLITAVIVIVIMTMQKTAAIINSYNEDNEIYGI